MMKNLRIFFVLYIIAMTSTLYSSFSDITELFPQENDYESHYAILPINDNSGEKIVFLYYSHNYCNKLPPMQVFHLDAHNVVTNISERLPNGCLANTCTEDVYFVSVNKNPTNPLVFIYSWTDLGCARLRKSELFRWYNNKFIKIDNVPYLVDEYFFGNSPYCNLVFFEKNSHFKQETLFLDAENSFIEFNKLKDQRPVLSLACSNSTRPSSQQEQFLLSIYKRRPHSCKKDAHKYAAPTLLEYSSQDQVINISQHYPDLKKLKRLRSAHLINASQNLYVYGVSLTHTAQFFAFNKESRTITEITQACGLEESDLQNIRSINFSNNVSMPQLVCIIYKNKKAKLFWFDQAVFTDITTTCGINPTWLRNVVSANLMQDDFGTTIHMTYFIEKRLSGISFSRIFYNPEMRAHHL